MRKVLSLIVPVMCFSLPACSTYSIENRLDTLEAHARHQKLLDMRLTDVESRVEQTEGDISGIKDRLKTPKEKREEQRKARTFAASAASPQVTGVVDLDSLATQDAAINDAAVDQPTANGQSAAAPQDSSYNQALAHLAESTGIPLEEPEPAAPQPRKVEPRKVEPRPVEPRKVEPRPVDPAKAEAQPAPTKVAAPKTQHRTGYDTALALYRKGEYAKANELFTTFLQTSPKSALVPNAIYWQGECAYSLGQYDQAIMRFKDVVGKYPKHDKAAAALLKAGYSYAHLKDMENARFYWQILLDDFPQSAPAQLARRRLESNG